MALDGDILAVLTSRKVFDGRTWRVYDSGGAELVDSGGVLWRGNHGALLWGIALPRVGQVYGAGRKRHQRVDDLTEDQVREHWDLLETRLKPRPDSTAPAVEPAPEARAKTLSAPAGQPVSPEARAAIAKSGVTVAGPVQPSAQAPGAPSIDAGAASISDAVRQARRAAEEALIFSLLQ